MNFRGKQWKKEGNAYRLVGTKIKVYQWNTGAKANFLIEESGKGTHTVHGKGAEARDRAISMEYQMAGIEITERTRE